MSADTSQHELIGVGFLCIDRLEFLLDHDETISIVSFSGFPVGNIKLTVRAYVDEVEPLPRTIITHVEANIQNFMDHAFIVNFYFDYISGLPDNHCTDTYISFKFMNHMPTYTTPQYLGYNPDPSLQSTVQVTKPITAALIDYLRTGCMEFKVFAVRSHIANQREETKSIETPQQSGIETPQRAASSWRSVATSSAGNTPSRSASFKGDKVALERKLEQTFTMAEKLLSERQSLDEQLQAMHAELQHALQVNEALQSELQSARAEIDNMYNISRGDGATIISNHESTMLPSASRGASFRTPNRFFFDSANNSAQIPEGSGSERGGGGGSKFCSIM
jgi:hypothetical protein